MICLHYNCNNPHHKHQTPLLHRNNMIRRELSHLAMARPRRKTRKKVFLFVLLLAFSHIPFFLERQTVRQPPDPPTELLHECCQQRTNLLLTPTFLFHMVWMSGLSLASIFALLDILLKLVFISCSLGVKYATADSLRVISR